MKVKKRLLAAISSLLLAASACVPLSASADSALLSTDKAAYTEGEAIMITAAGTGNDWVGIYRKGENPGRRYNPSGGTMWPRTAHVRKSKIFLNPNISSVRI